MLGVSGMNFRPSFGGSFREKFFAVGTVTTVRDPRGDTIWKVTGVSFVIQCELLQSLVAHLKIVEFVPQIPFPITAPTGDGGGVVDIR